MKQYARNIDPLGRVVLPKEIRRANNIEDGDLMYVSVTDRGILLTPVKDACEICGTGECVTDRNGIKICRECINKLRSES